MLTPECRRTTLTAQDGGDEAPNAVFPAPSAQMKTKAWVWKYNKSPLGTGEFHLTRQGSEKVWLVVRTVNRSAFTDADWDEFTVTVRALLGSGLIPHLAAPAPSIGVQQTASHRSFPA